VNIGLIALSGTRVRTAELAELGVTLPGFVKRSKTIASLPSLGLLTVAGLTPRRHSVSYLEIDDLNNASTLPDFDLVGLSSLTARIDEAYAVADIYRTRGTRVVMGGLHVSRLPQEALRHCHSVVVGGAEGIWPRLLVDVENGQFKPIYRGATDNVFTPELYARPRFELLQNRPYNRITIQTSRGCPRACEFCGASLMITNRFNQKAVQTVLAEIRAAREHFPEPFLEFADDNTFLNKTWAKDLLRALVPEGLRWFTETDASIADDLPLCDLLAGSGCRQLLIGFESPRVGDLAGLDPADWKREQAPRIRRVIDVLQSRGVSVNGCFILGLDAHTPDIFPALLDFVRTSGLAEVQFTVLTPFPDTPLYHRLRREGRLLNDRFWDRCTLFDVNYRPARMSIEELESGLRWLFKNSYSEGETSRRTRSFVRQKANARALS
jgi:radical SAM superfamily enzyme YgiQ (UPF0313 family)